MILAIRVFQGVLAAACIATPAFAQVTWLPTNGPYGGLIMSIAVTPGGTVFAAGPEGGLFRRDDEGARWTHVSAGIPPAFTVAFDSVSSAVFLGTTAGVFVSPDLGATWTPTTLGGAVLAIQANSLGHVFVITGDAFARSTDGGVTWTGLEIPTSGDDRPRALGIDAHDRILVGTVFGKIFVSTNGGDAWAELPVPWPTVTILSFGFGRGDDVYVGTAGAGVFRSRNAGVDWIPAGLTNVFAYQLAIDDAGRLFCASSGAGLCRSVSGVGNDWEQAQTGAKDLHALAVVVRRDGHVYAGMVATGVFLSTDGGGQWTPSNDGLTAIRCSGLLASGANRVFASTFSSGVQRTEDAGVSWSNAGLILETPICMLETTDGSVLAGTTLGIYRSADGGQSWNRVALPFEIVTALVKLRSGVILAGVPYAGLHRSLDGGITWERWGEDPADPYVLQFAELPNGTILAITWVGGVFASDDEGAHWSARGLESQRMYDVAALSTGRAFVATTNGAWFSDDAGVHWESLAMPEDAAVITVMADPIDRVWAGTSRGVFVSADRGITWQPGPAGWPEGSVFRLELGPNDDVYAQGYQGPVYRCLLPPTPVAIRDLEALPAGADLVLRWRATVSGDRVDFSVQRRRLGPGAAEPDFAPVATRVDAAGSGEYVWRDVAPAVGEYRYRIVATTPAGGVIAQHEIDAGVGRVPLVSRFLGNSPNPFNPSTTLAVALAGGRPAQILVVDVRGRVLRNLWRDSQPRGGDYHVAWDGRDDTGRNVGSGIYWAQLRVDGRAIDSRAMALVR